jgi:hypothetical protein
MKLNKYIYGFVAALVLLFTASCSPDDYNIGNKDLTAADLVEGVAFSVTIDQSTNSVTLKSMLDNSYQCFWVTPNGYSKGSEVTMALPFAGDYEVQFGVDTRGGVVYGDPYKFTLNGNNMELLKDMMYTYLTGGVGKTKKWVPVDKSYGVGQCSGPLMYLNPSDVLNDGSDITDLAFEKWAPNWDPGFQSWLIPADDPYMGSYMTFGLDNAKGCTLDEFRGESGTNTSATGTTMSGKWNMNLSDAKHPTMTFTNTYSLHNKNFDEVCNNYTTNIKIIELTPYIMQLATMRTNSEGSWWLVWNFVAADVQSGDVKIPTNDVLSAQAVRAPVVDDLSTSLFKIVTDDATYNSTSVTYLVNEDKPYGWYWWNGGVGSWETNTTYNSTYAPKATSDISSFALTLTKKSDGTYKYEEAASGKSGKFTISDNVITFDQSIPFVVAEGSQRTVTINTNQIYVVKADNDNNQFYFAVPDGKNSFGIVNQYLFANLEQKALGGSSVKTIKVDNSKLNIYVEQNKYLRIELYNPWGSKDWPIDPSKIKIAAGGKMNISFKINSGVTWNKTPLAALCYNWTGGDWEPNCFTNGQQATFNKDGVTTLTYTNTTGSKVTAEGNSCITITIQLDGYGTLIGTAEDVSAEITSMTIE